MPPLGELFVLEIPDAVRPALSWADATRTRIAARAPRPAHAPIAFTGRSALTIRNGDLAPVASRTEILVRTHSLADELARTAQVPRVVVDAADFDLGQRESCRAWDMAPVPPTGATVAGNHLRAYALRNASLLIVADDGFADGSPHYTVGVVTPACAALVAMARVAEAEDAVAYNAKGPWHVTEAALEGLDVLLGALEVDGEGTLRTFETVRNRPTSSRRGLQWNGPTGTGTALERFVSYVEHHRELFQASNGARSDAGLAPRPLNTMFDGLERATRALGFEPVLGREIDPR